MSNYIFIFIKTTDQKTTGICYIMNDIFFLVEVFLKQVK